jgi:L-rhamnose isomerase/sugar isomerase
MEKMTHFPIAPEKVAEHNNSLEKDLQTDYDHLETVLNRRGINIEEIKKKAAAFKLAIPSWGTSTGGTRFGVFSGKGEPRNINEKLQDCAAVRQLNPVAGSVSLHIPWDIPEDPDALKKEAEELGLSFDAINSNTFQDQPGQQDSYKFGSLTHTDKSVRDLAVAHNIECIKIGKKLGSKALSVWLCDGSNFPGQSHFRKTLDRYMESMKKIYKALPDNWKIYVEHKVYEPAFYSTVISDWGTNYVCVKELGDKACSLVDLGHHAPNVNIEQIVARLIALGKLGGFHFNDSKYGDDDLDSGSVKPFQLFLIFNELVAAEKEKVKGFDPVYMLDQSHNVTDPVESLINSAAEVHRAYVQAWLIDREALAGFQKNNDPMMALAELKKAYNTDVSPILASARMERNGAVEPVAAFRAAGYRSQVVKERG